MAYRSIQENERRQPDWINVAYRGVRVLLLLPTPLICLLLASATVDVSAGWSLNNFLMTGPKVPLMFAESLAAGASLGLNECRHQFHWERWNCPSSSSAAVANAAFPRAVKEGAFLHAISSAGVMYMLTKDCEMGHFQDCGCDDRRHSKRGDQVWSWGSCNDNTHFGETISKQFVDSIESGHDARAATNLHNNEAGRKAVRSTLQRKCKCHGVSGSCSIKTCWTQLPAFRVVGNFLKRKYSRAIMVDFHNGEVWRRLTVRAAREARKVRVSKGDLIYYEPSPDYCRANSSIGTAGTLGRECSRPPPAALRGARESLRERGSCQRLCIQCGFEVKATYVSFRQSCNCRFDWCCSVKCQSCLEKSEILVCHDPRAE